MANYFDEQEFLDAMYTYLYYRLYTARVAAGSQPIQVAMMKNTGVDNVDWAKIIKDMQPCLVFADGAAEHVKPNGCQIDYTMDFVAGVLIHDEGAGVVTGRVPKSTFIGVVKVIEELQEVLQEQYIIYDTSNAISLSNSQLLYSQWTSTAPSENHIGGENRMNFQTKTLSAYFQIRSIA